VALLQLNVSLDSAWPDNPIAGKYFVLVVGLGAIFRRRIQSSEVHLHYVRSLQRRVRSLANLGAIEYRGHLRE
jgi:hypothetical protein